MNDRGMTAVLVHGAWADGYSWARVIAGLEQAGIEAVAAPLPLTSLADDVAALKRSLARIEGPLILVGHAYAGAVIAQITEQRVAGLVYVAALAPDEGETVLEVFGRAEPHEKAPRLAPDGDGWIWLPDEAFADAFAQNASPEDQRVLAAVQRPISVSCITVPVGPPLWKTRPAWYLVAQDDRMIAASTQRFMAQRMQAVERSISADHAPSVSAPGEVIGFIADAARAFGSETTRH